MLSHMENESRARYQERKDNKDKIKGIIDLCEARNNNRKAAKSALKRRAGRDQITTTIIKSGTGLATKITVMLAKFTIPMANEWKTFVYLDRGHLYEDTFAVSV